jgi:protein SCO1/2
VKILALALVASVCLAAAPARALEPLPPGVDVVEKLNEPVPLDLTFTDEHGQTVRLGDYFKDGKPVLLTLVYYRCPMLCSLVLNGLTGALRQQSWQLGKEYRAVTLSIDPKETAELARKKQDGYLAALDGRDRALKAASWPFLVGTEANIKALADAVGFRYRWDGEQFDHTAVLIALSPEGKITRYLYGVQFAPNDVRMALFEASHGKVGTSLERALLRCYRFDATTKSYSVSAWKFARAMSLLVFACLFVFLLTMWRRDLRRSAGGVS